MQIIIKKILKTPSFEYLRYFAKYPGFGNLGDDKTLDYGLKNIYGRKTGLQIYRISILKRAFMKMKVSHEATFYLDSRVLDIVFRILC